MWQNPAFKPKTRCNCTDNRCTALWARRRLGVWGVPKMTANGATGNTTGGKGWLGSRYRELFLLLRWHAPDPKHDRHVAVPGLLATNFEYGRQQ